MKKELIKLGVESAYLDLLPSRRKTARAFNKRFISSPGSASSVIEVLLNNEGSDAFKVRGTKAFAVWMQTLRYIATVDPCRNQETDSLGLQADANMVLFAQCCMGETGTIDAFKSLAELSGFNQAVKDAASAFSLNFTLEASAPYVPGDDWHFCAEDLIDDPDADDDDPFSQIPCCVGVSVGCKKDRLLERKARKAMLQACLKIASEKVPGRTCFGGMWIDRDNAEPWRAMLAFMEAPAPRKPKARKPVWRKRKSRPLFADLPTAHDA